MQGSEMLIAREVNLSVEGVSRKTQQSRRSQGSKRASIREAVESAGSARQSHPVTFHKLMSKYAVTSKHALHKKQGDP